MQFLVNLSNDRLTFLVDFEKIGDIVIDVVVQPLSKKFSFEPPVRVKELLKKLDILPNEALVIRGRQILTKDILLVDNESVEIRLVTSRG